jgi:hypothetical protein
MGVRVRGALAASRRVGGPSRSNWWLSDPWLMALIKSSSIRYKIYWVWRVGEFKGPSNPWLPRRNGCVTCRPGRSKADFRASACSSLRRFAAKYAPPFPYSPWGLLHANPRHIVWSTVGSGLPFWHVFSSLQYLLCSC